MKEAFPFHHRQNESFYDNGNFYFKKEKRIIKQEKYIEKNEIL
jgi:CMP-N-acetylneuraminic acid synthetase